MRGRLRLIFMVFFCITTAWSQFPRKRTRCFQGWTGSDTGGSCSFSRGNLCDWTNSVKDQFNWTFEGYNIFLNNLFKRESDRAWLVGPAMCEREETDQCLTIRYRSDIGRGAQLALYVCEGVSSEDVCARTSNPVWSTRDWENDIWHVKDIGFKSSGRFQMLIEGKKHRDRLLTVEANVFIQYLKYKNTSCDAPQKVTSTTEQQITKAENDSNTQQTIVTTDKAMAPSEETTSASLMMPVVAAALLVVACAVVAGVVILRRRSRIKRAKRAGSATYTRNELNDLDSAAGSRDSARSGDIKNDTCQFYENAYEKCDTRAGHQQDEHMYTTLTNLVNETANK